MMTHSIQDYNLFNIGGTSSTYTGKSEFTEHAAGHLLKRVSPFVLDPTCDTNRPLLNEVSSEGFKKIERMVKETFPTCNINKILQVHAPQMYGMYLLRKEEILNINRCVSEKWLYHVTSESRAMKSLNSGLDWRLTRRSKFGRGVSFSDDIDYANYYADNSCIEDTRVIMICCVLVGKTYLVPKQKYVRNQSFAGSSLVVPPGLADTTISHNLRVHVKYNDNEFYPLFFVYYQRSPEQLNKSKYFRANNRRRLPPRSDQQLAYSIAAMNIFNLTLTNN